MNRLFGLSSFFFTILRKILFLWVRTDVIGNNKEQLNLDPEKPVCYVLQYSSLSNRLVLEQECLNGGLPSSQAPIKLKTDDVRRAFFFLYRRQGHWFRKRQSPIVTERLRQLVHEGVEHSDLDVQIVPVTLFWGRTPDKERSLFKLLLSDNWSVAGRLQKLLIILVQGRNTFVQFSKPISLRQIIDESKNEEPRSTRKLARVLRVHFRRVRQTVLGPDLSHRRTLVQSLIHSPTVKEVIRDTAKKEDQPVEKVKARALKYGDEIASNVSMPAVRFLDVVLTWVWNKIYNGVRINNLETVQEVSKDNAVVYVPCHRSHIDYLLLSYVLYKNGIMVPHIAAGINLNLPIVGSILRRGGAFFMRRSFKNNRLYAAVFNEYVHQVFSRGYSVEYFVEGGRSRTGRTLQPKAGMLAMTLKSYLRDHNKSIAFIPVYIGYEKVLEGRTYLGELRGKKKEKESVFGLFKTLRSLRSSFGKVNVNFGEPILMGKLLDETQPQWRHQAFDSEYKPKWLNTVVEDLAQRIAIHINNAAAINPINMAALVLLSMSRQAMDEQVLIKQMNIFSNMLKATPYGSNVSFPEGDGKDWVAYTEEMGLITRQKQDLGDIISLEGSNAILMTYYRNNVLHMFALPALIASLFQNNDTLDRERIHFLVRSIYPYIRSELFIRWKEDELADVIDQWIQTLVDHHLLTRQGDDFSRPEVGTANFVTLGVLAKVIIQTLERYYISIEILRRQGPGNITARELEEQSTQMAQRMSILFGLNAPEFFDKSLFHGFIATLKANDVLSLDAEGRLLYSEKLDEVVEDAKLVLNSELRQGILQVTSLN